MRGWTRCDRESFTNMLARGSYKGDVWLRPCPAVTPGHRTEETRFVRCTATASEQAPTVGDFGKNLATCRWSGRSRRVVMLKHIGLSLCLCLMAMGLNSMFVTSGRASPQHGQVTDRVTNGVTAAHQQGGALPARHPAHAVCSGVSETSTRHAGIPHIAHRTSCSIRGGIPSVMRSRPPQAIRTRTPILRVQP
jgi:hypothetical protein